MQPRHNARTNCLLLTIALALPVAAPTPARAENWPQWRGPSGQGVSPESDLPLEWSPAKNIAWKTPVPGMSHSQPIVWGDRVFLTTAIEGPELPGAKAPEHVIEGQPFKHPDALGADKQHTFKVLAYNLDTGKLLWEQTAYDGRVYDDRHRRGSYAAPTPVTDGRRLFAYFGSEGLYCYDLDGKFLWKGSVGQFPLLGMGVGTSPVLWKDLVIIQRDENNGDQSFIVAFDAATGKEAWKTPRPKIEASWATPVFVEAGGRPELVTNGSSHIIAYDPASGRELWRTKGVESNAIHTPLVGHGLVIVTAGYPSKKVIAIRPGGSGDITGTDRVAWQYDRGTGYVISPILYEDYLYLVSDQGLLTCIDPKTGEVKYEGGRVPVPARFMGSPVAFGGRLLLTSVDGDTFVIKAGPVHEVVGTNSVGETVWSSLALSQRRILVRGASTLYCIKAG